MNNNQVWKRHVDQMMKFKGEKSLNIGGETQGQSYVYLNTNAEDVSVYQSPVIQKMNKMMIVAIPTTSTLSPLFYQLLLLLLP
ncbi:hypothetical protein M8J77_004040 [Diaphorina citri]|nr:hypothetical protein M8J77_004040 [Diaphorina citri]